MTTTLPVELLQAVHSSTRVAGLTHDYYRYPARFSPLFVREAIKTFTKPGDVVLDPFAGGGTTMVEAVALGRRAVGTDINGLAVFVTLAKATPLCEDDAHHLALWFAGVVGKLSAHSPSPHPGTWREAGYQRNINCRHTWPIRKLLEIALAHVPRLQDTRRERFARCVLLRTAQWALDCRRHVPSAEKFRAKTLEHFERMVKQATALHALVTEREVRDHFTCVNRSVVGMEQDSRLKRFWPPKLILTSPPYPGVHVLYHRWQVQGRRETPAPFWIADSQDGSGAAYYTCGSRGMGGQEQYFDEILGAFRSLVAVCSRDTVVVQMVAFSEPSWQLPQYIDVMEQAGYEETIFPSMSSSPDGRIWRTVPNRKWYASRKGKNAASREVVLFHHLKRH